jgi:hypothetical protein
MGMGQDSRMMREDAVKVLSYTDRTRNKYDFKEKV